MTNLPKRSFGVDFGTLAGLRTTAELADLVTLWIYRMAQLESAYANGSPTWVNADSASFVEWTNDWTALKARYQPALDAAQATFTLTTADTRYTALAKAMRQCYPPDGCTVQKGDWIDLFNRMTDAATQYGFTPPVDNPPQPTAADPDLQILNKTAPLDVVNKAAQAISQHPIGDAVLSFLKDHWLGIGLVVVGVGVGAKVVGLAGKTYLKIASGGFL